MNEDRGPADTYRPAPQPPTGGFGLAEPPVHIQVGSRVDVRTVREVRTGRKVFLMKADSEDSHPVIEWLLKDHEVYRNKRLKFVLNNLMFAVSIGCFYMTVVKQHFYWLYPLFWVDFLAQFFSFYFYYLYPRQFRIRAYTFFRTSVYIHEVLSMLAKLLLFVIVDGYDGRPTEIAALLGVFCCILLFFTENLVYYNKAFDSIWNMQNCVTVGMLLLKVSGLVEMSYETAVFVLTLWIFIIYHLNQLTGWFWSVCWIGSIFKWVRPENRVFFGYQLLQSIETQTFCLLQLSLCSILFDKYFFLMSNKVLGIFKCDLEATVIVVGIVQIAIITMQLIYGPDEIQIDEFEGIPQVQEVDLFVEERYSVTVDIQNLSTDTQGPQPAQEAPGNPIPAVPAQTAARVNQQPTTQVAPVIHSGNHEYPRMPGESSGQASRGPNPPRVDNSTNRRNTGVLRFIHTASTLLSRQNHSSNTQQSAQTGQLRQSFRPDENDTDCRCCMTRPKNAMVMPCYHFAYCDICTKELLKIHKQTQEEKARNNSRYVKKPFTCEFCKVPVKEIYEIRQVNSKEYITVSKIFEKEQ